MGPLIRVRFDPWAEIHRLERFFKDKERQRSNRAARIGAGEWRPACPTNHARIAWSGPPHDSIQAITCLDCGAFVTEPEIRDRGFDFNNCPDWVFFDIMEEKRTKRFRKGNPFLFSVTR